MSALQRRRRGLFAAIVADPWRKLLAIGLAIVSWFFVDSRVSLRIERSLPLDTVTATAVGPAVDRLAVALPNDRIVKVRFRDGDQTLTHATVVISGPRFKVEALQGRPLDLLVTETLRLDWTGRDSVEFTPSDLARDQRLLQDLRIEFVPPRILLDVEHLTEDKYPLAMETIALEEGPFAGRVRRETAEFAPEVAVVLGPKAATEQFARQTGKRFRVRVTGAANDRQITAPLEFVDAPPGVRFATPPTLTMQILPQTSKFELDLPVLVDDLALPPEQRGNYVPDARSRTVRVAAGGELRSRLVNAGEGSDAARVAEWAAANLRLLVVVPRPDAGATPARELDLTARLLLVDRRLANTVDRNECLLDESVVVKLRHKQ